jgi:DNA-binding transcriptional ArsR family regulator
MSALLLVLLTLLGGLLSLALLVLFWVLQALAGKEAEAIVQSLASDLLRRTERRLPVGQRARFSEETRAGLLRFSEKRPAWALIQALSLFLSARGGRLAEEFEIAETEEVHPVDSSAATKVIAHPLRVRILVLLNERPAAQSDLALQLETDPGSLGYHLAVLRKQGIVEVAEVQQKRGIARHIYRATRRQYLTDESWRRMGQPGLEPGTDGL